MDQREDRPDLAGRPEWQQELMRKFNIVSPSTKHTTFHDLPPKMQAHIRRLGSKNTRVRLYRRSRRK